MIKVLYVRKIGIDAIPNSMPFIELRINLHLEDESGVVKQIVPDYKRLYKKMSEFPPIPLTTEANDGIIDGVEMMNLVGKAAIHWVAVEYNGVVNSQGKVVIT